MAYSVAWDETTPSDAGSDANKIGTYITNDKKAVRERLETGLIVDMTADPVVLKDAITGKVTGLQSWIPASAFVPATTANSPLSAEASYWDYTQGAIAGGLYRMAPIMIPRGVTITKLDVIAQILTSGTSTAAIKHLTSGSAVGTATPSYTQDAIMNMAFNANGFFNLYTSTTLAITVAAAWYALFITQSKVGDRLIGAVITYDRPSNLVGN